MALYRRFAVYLYQYQGAKKGAGAGFGMIELRDGRIRMQLTGRGSAAQGNLEVYGLLDAPAEMAGVRLGSMQAGRFVLEAGEDIGEGKLFSDLRGIVLTARPGAERAVAALWNGTFDAGRFVQWKAEKKLAEPEAKIQQPFQEPAFPEGTEESSRALLSEGNKAALSEETESQLWGSSNAQLWEGSKADLCKENRADLCEDRSTDLYEENRAELCEGRSTGLYEENRAELCEDRSTGLYEENRNEFQEESKSELCVESDAKWCEKDGEELSAEMLSSDTPAEDSCLSFEENVPADISCGDLGDEMAAQHVAIEPFPQKEQEESDSAPLWESPHKTSIKYIPPVSTTHLDFASAALDLVEFGTPLEIESVKPCRTEPVKESALWQRLSKQYPKMNIPVHQGSLSCLRIRPCDINRLPKENWKYGCSHFLARHYNRYRCLILGRTQHKNGWEYFMGVPGGNTPQERKQAAEAGFDHYIAVEKGHGQWPEGFWLVQLQWVE